MAAILGSVKTAQQGIRELWRPWLDHRNRLHRLVLPSLRRKNRKELLDRRYWTYHTHDRTRSRRVG